MVAKRSRKGGRESGRPRLNLVPDDSPQSGPLLPDDVADLRRMLTTMGAPPDLLALLDSPDGLEMLRGMAGAAPTDPNQAFEELVDGFAPLLDKRTDPLHAELSGAEFLGMLAAGMPAPEDLLPMLLEMIGQAEQRGGPESLAMLRALGAVVADEVRPAAVAAADRLVAEGLTDPPWVAGLGSPTVGPAFGQVDPFGAQESIAITFSYGKRRHAVMALIDHDLGGGVKDCWVTDDAARVRKEYQRIARQGALEYFEYSPDEAHDVLSRALANPLCPEQPDQVRDVSAHLALLRRRVLLLAPPGAALTPQVAGA